MQTSMGDCVVGDSVGANVAGTNTVAYNSVAYGIAKNAGAYRITDRVSSNAGVYGVACGVDNSRPRFCSYFVCVWVCTFAMVPP